MKCYYEELAVDRDANESEIKSAYRKLALKWHPDKNPQCIEAAKERFQLIQQAYEVLSDPQERSWYDNHREQILRGKNSDYEDNCLDLFQYFTVSCFKGYGDDTNGFYTVYKEVFEKIAAEDAEFMDDEEDLLNIPEFGDSTSSYEEIVGPFYAYWSAYCTKRTYTWLCPYDVKEIKDRRILREIEKDMKKVVQKAKKERNDEVRNLVSFVRKRDKRIQAFKKMLEERSAFNRQKQERNRLEQIRRRQQELEEMRQNSQGANGYNDDYEEQLKQLEQEYSSGDESYEDEPIEYKNLEEKYDDGLYCVACNKEFKTEKSFNNHELSRKHRDNIEKLKLEMQGEETIYQQGINLLEEEETLTKQSEVESVTKESEAGNGISDINIPNDQQKTLKNISSKTKSKKDARNTKRSDLGDKMEEVVENFDFLAKIDSDDEDWNVPSKKLTKKNKNKSKVSQKNSNLYEKESQAKADFESVLKNEAEVLQHICVTCKSKFDSKNKLFSHLKITNHGVFIPKTKTISDENSKSKKTKGKRIN